MPDYTIIPSITTHTGVASDWRSKISEIAPLNLQSVALFLTGTSENERYELYYHLEHARRTHHFTVPFVHAVSDMKEDEYRFFVERFQTTLFNLHPVRQFPLAHTLSETIRQMITIENAYIDQSINADDLVGFKGICLDIAHAEDLRRSHPAEFAKLSKLIADRGVLANHISVINRERRYDSHGQMTFHAHELKRGDTSYLANYAPRYFGEIICIELKDSLADQVTLLPDIASAVRASRERAVKIAA
jgi:hypothetical protein